MPAAPWPRQRGGRTGGRGPPKTRCMRHACPGRSCQKDSGLPCRWLGGWAQAHVRALRPGTTYTDTCSRPDPHAARAGPVRCSPAAATESPPLPPGGLLPPVVGVVCAALPLPHLSPAMHPLLRESETKESKGKDASHRTNHSLPHILIKPIFQASCQRQCRLLLHSPACASVSAELTPRPRTPLRALLDAAVHVPHAAPGLPLRHTRPPRGQEAHSQAQAQKAIWCCCCCIR